eukprot:303362-Pelagomonas_calceolata.AAC.1
MSFTPNKPGRPVPLWCLVSWCGQHRHVLHDCENGVRVTSAGYQMGAGTACTPLSSSSRGLALAAVVEV